MSLVPNENAWSHYRSAQELVHVIMEDAGMHDDPKMQNREDIVIRWLFDANREFRIPINLEDKYYQEYVVDGTVPKPCDYIVLAKVTVTQEHITPQYVTSKYPHPYEACPNVNHHNQLYTFYEDHHTFHFGSNLNGEIVNVWYKAYHFDEDGFPFIDERWKEAYIAWVQYKYNKQQGNMSRAEYWRKEMKRWSAHSRGNKNLDSLSRDRVNVIMAKLRDPFYLGENEQFNRITRNRINDIYNFPASYGRRNLR